MGKTFQGIINGLSIFHQTDEVCNSNFICPIVECEFEVIVEKVGQRVFGDLYFQRHLSQIKTGTNAWIAYQIFFDGFGDFGQSLGS